MTKIIPTYNIEILSGQTATNPDIYFADYESNNKNLKINLPYRSNYYGIGVCIDGHATLKANLETFNIETNCIITMSPQIIKQWINYSTNYKTIAVFFTKDFFIKNNSNKNFLDSFLYFDQNAKHVSLCTLKKAKTVKSLLQSIQLKLNSTHPFKNEIVRSLTTILLYEISADYNQEKKTSNFKLTRNEQIVSEFKKLVTFHFIKERNVKFYADLIFISPKHLSEIIKFETGKTAKDWINEIVILEAKVLLQNESLTIAIIADNLNFSNQSSFGKFFKNISGISPLYYRQNL